MHGHGHQPQQPEPRPSAAVRVTVRVVVVLLTVLSCGFLGWVAMLRLAILTREVRDWLLLVVVAAFNGRLFLYFADLPADPEDMESREALIGLGALAALVTGVLAYYLYAEIRHFADARPAAAAPAAAGHPPAPASPYHLPAPQPQHPNPYAAPTPPPTSMPTPPRLDQVRAELDELSAYLRKEGGGR
ncbi:hypothetical protein ACIP6P_18730 [Streptomyces sp. NPDC088729]|uniref:hypothetical protein n=1 Tax=Streptomyces sp. NPDC088729 TaxID=3365876 RepID=UPI0038098C6A